MTETPAPMGAPKIAELVKALVAAQKAIKGITKDRTNNRFGYAYTSAEAMLTEVREVLADNGLTVIPTSTTIRVEAGSIRIPFDGGVTAHEGHAVLFRTYLIAHESGEAFPASQEWPIVPEKGRPLDKATASADTASLSYFLRDLLKIPRVEPGTDLDGDDRDVTDPESTDRQRRRIREELARLGVEPAKNGHERAMGSILKAGRRVAVDSLTMQEAERVLDVLENTKEPKPKDEAKEEPTDGQRHADARAAADAAFGDSPPVGDALEEGDVPITGDYNSVPDEESEGPEGGGGITWMQTRAIAAILDDLNLPADVGSRMTILSSSVGRVVKSLEELTEPEAGKAIASMNEEIARRQTKPEK